MNLYRLSDVELLLSGFLWCFAQIPHHVFVCERSASSRLLVAASSCSVLRFRCDGFLLVEQHVLLQHKHWSILMELHVLLQHRHWSILMEQHVLLQHRHWSILVEQHVLLQYRHWSILVELHVLLQYRHWSILLEQLVLLQYRHWSILVEQHVLLQHRHWSILMKQYVLLQHRYTGRFIAGSLHHDLAPYTHQAKARSLQKRTNVLSYTIHTRQKEISLWNLFSNRNGSLLFGVSGPFTADV